MLIHIGWIIKAPTSDNQSDKFHAELIHQQKIQLPDQEPVGLIHDVVTSSGHCSGLSLHFFIRCFMVNSTFHESSFFMTDNERWKERR